MRPGHGIALGAVLVLALAPTAGLATPAPQPPPLTVRVAGAGTSTALHLQPGFATVLRADHEIDTVAIGDPRLVTATAVKRGQDVYDLILQPQVDAGATNMVLWFGEITTVWNLEIGTGLRTADVVYVITGVRAAPRGASSAAAEGGESRPASPAPAPASSTASPPAVTTAPAPAAAAATADSSPAAKDRAPAPGSGQAPPAAVAQPGIAGAASGPPPAQGAGAAGGPLLLEVREAVGDLAAVFQIVRTPDGVLIRYRIANGNGADLTIRPTGVLVRVNGRVAPYAMARDSVDRGRPDVLPRGGTETGVIDVPGRTARFVQLIFSLFPVPSGSQASAVALPLTFEPSFNGVDQLATTASP